jgi:hypothetical protein
MKRHPWLVSASLVAVAVVLTGPAVSAQTYPPKTPTVGLSDTTVSRGGSTTVSGHNWLGGSKVTLELVKGSCSGPAAQGLGSASVNGGGDFEKTVTLDVTSGQYGIGVSGRDEAGDPATRCATVQVLGEAAEGAVASTGADILFGMMLAIALAVIGVIALVAGRRRAGLGAPR